MAMIVLGVLALIAGVAMALIGNAQNNSISAQLGSLLNNGTANPGNTLLFIGIAVAVVGVILLIAGVVKKKR
jgi:3-oxoacyl-[acyl-carrier-protein] synthase III